MQAATQGRGVALGSPQLAAYALHSGLLVAPFPAQLLHRKGFYWMLPPGSAEDAAARAFCTWLQDSGQGA